MTLDALHGKRIVVTRSVNQSVTLLDLLKRHGAVPLHVPLIEICPPSDNGISLRREVAILESFDWVVVTSANGASAIGGELNKMNRKNRPQIAAIGKATNNALGSIADFVPSIARGDVLAAEFPSGSGQVLLVQAEFTDGVLATSLKSRGWNVIEVSAYQTRMVRPDPDAIARAINADALVLASGSAARSWVQNAGTHAPPIVVAIGQFTAAVSKSVGISITQVTAEPTPMCVVETLADIFARHHP